MYSRLQAEVSTIRDSVYRVMLSIMDTSLAWRIYACFIVFQHCALSTGRQHQ
jgi:hypothetical protein